MNKENYKYRLTDEELDDLLWSTETLSKDSSEAEMQLWRNRYREVEEENIKQIDKAGGIDVWYASGQGRLL